MTSVLTISGLEKRFGQQQVLKDFNLDVRQGEIVGLLGPNGCGKSTVLNIVSQLLPAKAAAIELMGQPIAKLGVKARTIMGVCSQDRALYPDLLPEENLDFFARLYGLSTIERRVRIEELMNLFGLAAHAKTRVGRLSGGWQQRLHLAVSIVHQPQLLILDEPTAAVDVAAKIELWRLIENLRKSGTSILLTTHQLSEAEQLCDRVALMSHGRVAALGSVSELLSRLQGQTVVKVQSSDHQSTRSHALRLGWRGLQSAGELSFLLDQSITLSEAASALDGPEVSAISVQALTLEDAYLELIGQFDQIDQNTL